MTAAASNPVVPVATWTAAPGGTRWIALYDGDCRFCTRQAKQLERIVGASRIEAVSFQEEGALRRFPGVSHEACMQRIHVIRPDGRVYAAAEAVARAMTLVPVLGWLAWLYYLPGVRPLADRAYRVIARNRYRIAGRSGECDGGTCSLHR